MVEFRVGEPVGKDAVVREEQKPRRVLIESPHRKQLPTQIRRQEISHSDFFRTPSFGSFVSLASFESLPLDILRHHPHGLMHHIVQKRSARLENAAVHLDPVNLRIRLLSEQSDDAIHTHQTRIDDLLRFTARSNSARG